MSANYNNTANPSSEGSVHSAVIWISMVVAVALSALYLALTDVSGTKFSRVATQPGVTSELDAGNAEAFTHQEPFGIDLSVVNK